MNEGALSACLLGCHHGQTVRFHTLTSTVVYTMAVVKLFFSRPQEHCFPMKADMILFMLGCGLLGDVC